MQARYSPGFDFHSYGATWPRSGRVNRSEQSEQRSGISSSVSSVCSCSICLRRRNLSCTPKGVEGAMRRGVGLLLGVNRSLLGNAPEFLDSFVKGLARLGTLGLRDRSFAHAPELLDGFDAPKRAGPRSPDRLAAHQDIDRIRVKLRKMTEGDPGAL